MTPHSAQVAIIGGGPAGLQAALTLGRMHMNTVLFDDGEYRNDSSARMHNVLGWDGTAPAELRDRARAELAAYPTIRLVDERVTAARVAETGFSLSSASAEWRTERILIATGVRDALLPIPGVRELWGDVVLPCPYCHGHEFAAGPIAVISAGGHAEHVGGLLRGIADDVPVVAPEDVAEVARADGGVAIILNDGRTITAASVFIPPHSSPRTAMLEGLGVAFSDDGIEVDVLGRTSVSDVWAAGDVARRVDAHIPAAIILAAASGLTAAADIAAAVGRARDAG